MIVLIYIYICICVCIVQEIEPSVGEKLCRLWLTLSSDGSSSPVNKERRRSSHYHHDSSQQAAATAIFPGLTPFVAAPFAHPSLGLFTSGGRAAPHIHLNPSLYQPPRLEPSVYFRPPRNYQGPTKRYSAQHRARSNSRTTTTAMDSTVQ